MKGQNLFGVDFLPLSKHIKRAHGINNAIGKKVSELDWQKWIIVETIVNKIEAKIKGTKDNKLLQLLEVRGGNGNTFVPCSEEPLLRGLIALSLTLSEDKKSICFKSCRHAIRTANVENIFNANSQLAGAVQRLNNILFGGKQVIKFNVDVTICGSLMTEFIFDCD